MQGRRRPIREIGLSPRSTLEQVAELRAIVLGNAVLRAILDRWDDIDVPDCWLVAGAIAQSVWNHAFHLPPGHGLSDVDLVYFDATDLSEETEAQHAARVRVLFSDLAVWIDVKNEARVHLWYEARFGNPIRPYVSTVDAIATFPTTASAIGLQQAPDELRLFAPFGLSDLLGLIVSPNKTQITRSVYRAKVERWLSIWPELQVVSWEAAVPPGLSDVE